MHLNINNPRAMPLVSQREILRKENLYFCCCNNVGSSFKCHQLSKGPLLSSKPAVLLWNTERLDTTSWTPVKANAFLPKHNLSEACESCLHNYVALFKAVICGIVVHSAVIFTLGRENMSRGIINPELQLVNLLIYQLIYRKTTQLNYSVYSLINNSINGSSHPLAACFLICEFEFLNMLL